LLNGLLPIELSGDGMDRLQALVSQTDGAQPFSVDLPAQIVRAPNGETFAFEISTSDKTRLIEGLDEVGLTMKHENEIVAFEEKIRAAMPWMQEARDRRL
jgi:3-isopropylmalate dehydratase small subunit